MRFPASRSRLVVAACLACLAVGASALVSAAAPAPSAAAAEAGSRVSLPAQSATDGQRTLVASPTSGLDPAGSTVVVSGSGYDTFKGIYVAFCLVPPPGHVPSPCGGGVDLTAETGMSQWISSNPPPYGEGLAIPYGPGGTFTVELSVGPLIGNSIDCRRVRCAVVTRNDHTRSTDRSQDLLVPVSFAAPAGPTEPGVPPPPLPPVAAEVPGTEVPGGQTAPQPDLTVPRPVTAPPPPSAVLGEDGRSTSAGGMQLRLSDVELSADGDTVAVTGTGFSDRATEVALCAVAVVGDPPSVCGPAVVVVPSAGVFAADLDVDPSIDPSTDCRETSCAVLTRNHLDHADRSEELAVPVRFVAPPPPAAAAGPDTLSPVVADAGATPATGVDGRDSAGWVTALAIAAALGVVALGALIGTRLVARSAARRHDPGAIAQ